MRVTFIALAVTLVIGTALARAPGATRPAASGSSGLIGRPPGAATAGGDRNQAVTTTDADAAEPARWFSSFTEGQARGRFEGKDYAGVTNLAKDDEGVSRGTAMKNGASMQAWLDYKGNVGQATGSARTAATGTTEISR